jgi:ribosomal protein S6
MRLSEEVLRFLTLKLEPEKTKGKEEVPVEEAA